MRPMKLAEFLSTQFPEYHPLPFENECNTQLLLHIEPNASKKIINWIRGFKPDTSHKSTINSDRHREEGNRLFRSNKKLYALEASRCYTNAILAAPDGSKSLSLAHANRSAAIAEFGYYKEAYEDCQCAIDYGYPDENLPKIVIRQAYCANKLKDYDKLKVCLEKLRTMTLTVPFAIKKTEFERELTKLMEENTSDEKPEYNANYMVQTILKHPQTGRYMTASKNIAKGEKILVEKAFSLVPVNDAKICSNCAVQKIIPFPCNVCSKVYYCSLKCRKAQEMVHRFECYAYRCGFFEDIGITHLGMNTLLNGLPSIIPSLQECSSPMEIWRKIETIAKSGEKGYAEVLSLITNLNLKRPHEIRSFSLVSAIVCYYLKELTAFFTLFEGCACGAFEWGIIVSALILRHSTQMVSNAHSCLAIVCLDTSYDFFALSDIWAKPKHLKRGQLYKFSRVYINYAGIFPYMSSCNHSCAPSIVSRFDGDRVISTARRHIKKGGEIYNTYMSDYRNNPRSVRQEELNSIYHFDCKCKRCTENSDDREFLTFYRYCCQSSHCEAIFTAPNESLRWWTGSEQETPFLTCPVCGTKLNLDWYWHFERFSKDPTRILEVLQIVNFSGQILVGFSELRKQMVATAVYLFFEAWQRGVPISLLEFKEIGEVINYWLDVIEQQNDIYSVVYVAKATFALDLMARGHFLNFNCKKIHISFKMLPHELRIVFENYIDDYIGDRFSY